MSILSGSSWFITVSNASFCRLNTLEKAKRFEHFGTIKVSTAEDGKYAEKGRGTVDRFPRSLVRIRRIPRRSAGVLTRSKPAHRSSHPFSNAAVVPHCCG